VSPRTTNTYNNNNKSSTLSTLTHCRTYTKIKKIKYYKPFRYIMIYFYYKDSVVRLKLALAVVAKSLR
jgi:hypothetical protein